MDHREHVVRDQVEQPLRTQAELAAPGPVQSLLGGISDGAAR
ncbi:MAG: hypothetical protein ACRDTJ_27375 [Pseudonocardiaceae bacterium]